jgi:hypothetical protein
MHFCLNHKFSVRVRFFSRFKTGMLQKIKYEHQISSSEYWESNNIKVDLIEILWEDIG